MRLSRSLPALLPVVTLGAVVLWGLGPGHRTAAAQRSQGTLAACVERVINAARAQGATPATVPVVDFMLSGDERSYEYGLPEDGCLGVLAIGHRQVQHIGLALFAPSGRALAQDESRGAHAYARFCGRGGRRVVADLRMLAGEGEFYAVPLWNAPPNLDALEATLSTCMSTGDPRPDLIDVGPEPAGRPIDVELHSLAGQLSALGYRLEGGVLFGGLAERRREIKRVALEGGRCYALAAVGDGDVEDIDMRLLSIADSASLVAADITRHRDAVIKVCPDRPAVYVLDVRMYRGAGSYIVQSFGLAEPAEPPPPGVDGSARIAYSELRAKLAARGMRATPAVWGALQPEGTQSIPVNVVAGRCYGIAVVASTDFGSGDIDLSLVEKNGRVLAAEIGPGQNPLVFHCAERDATLRAVVQAHEVRRLARFLLLLGEDEPAPLALSQAVH